MVALTPVKATLLRGSRSVTRRREFLRVSIAGMLSGEPITIMWSIVENFLHRKEQSERFTIESDSPASLVLLSGNDRIVFDRLTRAVTQRGKQVATFGTIKYVLAREARSDDGSPVWQISLQLKTSREVTLGRCYDDARVYAAAARVAGVTGAQTKRSTAC